MPVSSPVTPIQLTWVKSRIKGRHELSADGPILGALQRVGFWKSVTQAEFKGRTWSFQRCGVSRTAIMEEPGARPIAEFKANWLGGGMLTFNDGDTFQLTARGFWRPVWSWIDRAGKRLLEVIPHQKRVRVTDAKSIGITDAKSVGITGAKSVGVTGAQTWNSQADKLPVLIMFSWHQILQTNDDAAAAATISVAAAG
jgi:hypothetical protein